MPLAHASSYKVIWNFRKAAYGIPESRLLLSNGVLFGTSSGGTSGYGMAFQLSESGGSWSATELFAFDGRRGSKPLAGMVQDSNGSLHGTTQTGGKNNSGTAFELSLSSGKWTESVLHSFGGTNDGSGPSSDLILAPSTNTLFGTTPSGGAHGAGAVFSLTETGGVWKENVLYSFKGADDGTEPLAGLLSDSSGALYGTTVIGGSSGVGTIFKLIQSGSGWKKNKLFSFNASDGAEPDGVLVADSSGALYGTTYSGGAYGYGNVFILALSGGAWHESVLWNFEGGTQDGAAPEAGLYMDSAGVLYGTTGQGGTNGYGTVFEVSQSGGKWVESVLHNFGSSNDGRAPVGALIEDASGNLYGTTAYGGTSGDGTVFELTP